MRRLSSHLTFVTKFVFPPLWIGAFIAGTLFWFAHPFDDNGTPQPQMPWLFIGLTVLGILIIWQYCLPLKRVDIDPRNLHVSNFWKRIRIPLRYVRGVDRSLFTQFMRRDQIVVYFWTNTEFGDHIIFIPRWTGQVFNWKRPIEDEICNAVAAAGGSGLYPPDSEPTTTATS